MKNIRLVVCGIGRVGREFLRLLNERGPELEKKYSRRFILSAAADIGGAALSASKEGLDPGRLLAHLTRGGSVENFETHGQPGLSGEQAIKNSDARVLIEATPTNLEHGQPAGSHILAAIEQGMDVVSANKGPFVLFYKELHEAARQNNCGLHISAATAAALPTLDVARICLAGTRVQSAEGILNGTTNYILTQMSLHETSYAAALKQAQDLGIAETDPSYDVEGMDTANKIILICNRIFNTSLGLKDITVQGITSVTPEDIKEAAGVGQIIKLIGSCEIIQGLPRLSVAPRQLDQDHPLARINGSEKAITYMSDTMGAVTVSGGKSSPVGAAAALLKDLINAEV
ncbi:MAG: homoserine dehydrogenase [Desulfonatronovibrio sp.]